MSKIILNEGQQRAADAAIDWFKNSSEQTFQIVGHAGTGKSVVISEILRRLKLKDDEVLPMAFTGQACTIMRKRGMPKACTLHSGLYTAIKKVKYDKYGHPIMNPILNTPVCKWTYIPKDFTDTKIKLIIIDEAWMVPVSMRSVIDRTGIKVLAAGDDGQLPPVHGSPGYLTSGIIYRLTELMRQSENSPIVYLANRARNGEHIEPGVYGNSAIVMFDEDLDNEILSRSNVVLCGTNRTRDQINWIFRNEILGIHVPQPTFGERVICRENNWDIEVDGYNLVNGLTGFVASNPEVSWFNRSMITFDFLPDLINQPFRHLDVNYQYITCGSKEERKAIKDNPYSEGEMFEFAYASTVHLSQGSEYETGTYIEEYVRSDFNAMNYTAITRFKTGLIYVMHKPKFWTI